jgi:hypothetical protein
MRRLKKAPDNQTPTIQIKSPFSYKFSDQQFLQSKTNKFIIINGKWIDHVITAVILLKEIKRLWKKKWKKVTRKRRGE